MIPTTSHGISRLFLLGPAEYSRPDAHIYCSSRLPSCFLPMPAAAQRGAASSGRGGGTVAASISRGAMPLKEGFLMRNTRSSTSSTALSGVDAPLVTPAMKEDVSH